MVRYTFQAFAIRDGAPGSNKFDVKESYFTRFPVRRKKNKLSDKACRVIEEKIIIICRSK
jgi:hypothetical protein